MTDLTISIVSYNTKDLLISCIESAYRNLSGFEYEIIVVDNNSKDNSANIVEEKFPKVKIIRNKENLFFSRAHNQALKIASGRYFLILNSDTYFIDGSLINMIDFLDNSPQIGASEGIQEFPDGAILSTCSMHSSPINDIIELTVLKKIFKDSPRLTKYRLADWDRKSNREVDVACDAFLLVRTELLRSVGGYDETLKLYYTENDLCMRIQKQGCKVFHFADARVIHHVSASANKEGYKKISAIYKKDLLNYYRKTWSRFISLFMYCTLTIDSIMRDIWRLLKCVFAKR